MKTTSFQDIHEWPMVSAPNKQVTQDLGYSIYGPRDKTPYKVLSLNLSADLAQRAGFKMGDKLALRYHDESCCFALVKDERGIKLGAHSHRFRVQYQIKDEMLPLWNFKPICGEPLTVMQVLPGQGIVFEYPEYEGAETQEEETEVDADPEPEALDEEEAPAAEVDPQPEENPWKKSKL